MRTSATTQKQTILVLFGGESPEHDVSIMSAHNIYAAINQNKYTPILCYIDKTGRWWQVDSVTEPHSPTTMITPLLGMSAVKISDSEVPIDVIFPALHGHHGEDGTIQGLAALLHTPIVGCSLDGSVLCIDKVLTKQLLTACDIPVAPYKTHRAGDPLPKFEDLTRQLGATLFVKPVHQGSSIGAGKARTATEFSTAIKTALQYDNEVLIEPAIKGIRELEIAARETAGGLQLSTVGEITPDRDFYSYESKYAPDATSTLAIPADIPHHLSVKIQSYASKAFDALHCRGLARIDFFLDAENNIYLNEINTLPGFTNISMYPKLWEDSGMSYAELIEALIDQVAPH